MAWTLTTLKQSTQDYLESDETTFVNELDSIIRLAEDRIIKDIRYLPMLRKNATGSLSAATSTLTIPDDLLAVLSFAIGGDTAGTYTNYTYLLPKEVGFLREVYPNPASTAKPKYYSYNTEEDFLLAPTPDLAYGYDLAYFYKPESITDAAGGTSWMGDHMENTLFSAVLLEGYIFLKGDADLMQIYQQRYQEALVADKSLIGMTKMDEYRRVN